MTNSLVLLLLGAVVLVWWWDLLRCTSMAMATRRGLCSTPTLHGCISVTELHGRWSGDC